MLLEDSKRTVEMCDNSWHLVQEGNSNIMAELRISKLAAQKFLNVLDDYRHDLEMAQKQLVDLIGTKHVIAKYYDPE